MFSNQNHRSRDVLIALSFLDFLTPARMRRLLGTYDPIEQLERASPTDVAALLNVDHSQAVLVTKGLQLPALARAVENVREQVVTILDQEYSPMLRQIHDPPAVLFFRGNLQLLQQDAISVVGSRRASPYALAVTQRLGRELVNAGLVIVSGLARGIDAAAHEAALRNGGSTIGVLGTGIDMVYPRFHRRLYDQIAETGLLLTEFPPGTPPRPTNFPVRNRIIAGLSRGTLIVEASSRSGSLITARLAVDEGREVFAVPGSILSAGSEGVHRLIKTGAKLVHEVNDILEELGLVPKTDAEISPIPEELRGVLEVFSSEEPLHVDVAIEKTKETVATLSEKLLQLELGGWLRALPGSRYVRT